MPIKIKSTSGGSVTIDVPSTAVDTTMMLPVTNAGLVSNTNPVMTGNVAITGNVSVTGTGSYISINGDNFSPYPMRNRIINGGFDIWQRNTIGWMSGAVTYVSADRWSGRHTGGANSSISQSTSVPSSLGFKYSAKVGRSSGSSTAGYIELLHAIETNNSITLQGQPVTLSFYARSGANFSSTSSILAVYIFTGTGTDQATSSMGTWTGVATPATQNFTLTTSWQRFTLTGTIGSTVTQIGLYFNYQNTGTSGADDNFYITGVQLEAGTVATPFEFRHYGTELALCQRYYSAVSLLHYDTVGSAYNGLTQTRYAYHIGLSLPVQQRASPTITYTMNVGPGTDVSANFASTQNDGRYIRWRNAGSGFATTGDIYVSFTASAEL
jgi:hypothetical protein